MSAPPGYRAFERYGIEIEYMIVDADTLDIKPIADEVLRALAGSYVNEVARGPVTWSNELVAHVIELKVTEPAHQLHGIHETFQRHIEQMIEVLSPFGARLMPTGMHPWMDPIRETRLWPHAYDEIYRAFDRIFDCRGHGWANLQSVHLNLPFADAQEFGRLHAAIRFLMPLMPALAASSPILECRANGVMDNRLDVYRTNCARIPSVTGSVIPEPVFTPEAYAAEVLEPMYRDIAPFDPEGILQEEWLNARGAIARFERNTIEVRVLDTQECAEADLAVVNAIVTVLRRLFEGEWVPFERQASHPTHALFETLLATIAQAERAVIRDTAYLDAFGIAETNAAAGEVWSHLLAGPGAGPRAASPTNEPAVQRILTQGPLARRILNETGPGAGQQEIREVYRGLCECLDTGSLF